MNTIRIELCQEDRDRLDRILAALENFAGHDCSKCVDTVAKLHTVMQPEPEQPAEETPEPEAPTEVTQAPEQPTVSREEVQKKVVALSAAGKKAEVKKIVTAYENTKVSDIPEDKLAEVWDKLTALEG